MASARWARRTARSKLGPRASEVPHKPGFGTGWDLEGLTDNGEGPEDGRLDEEC